MLSSLSRSELAGSLSSSGIYLKTGPFTVCVQSKIDYVADGLSLLYANHRFSLHEPFADFYIRLARPASYRRWIRPQVEFTCDGEAPFKPLPLKQAFPMLEWAMNWCISSRAHTYLVIHAAVVEKNGLAAILPAPPGSGKSTLCAALAYRGWRLLSDELALISTSTGNIAPIPRPISLKNESIGVIRNFAANAILSSEVTDTLKGTIAHLLPPPECVLRDQANAAPGYIVFPRYNAESGTVITGVPKARALMKLAQNTFNLAVLRGKGFETLARTVDRSQCYDFSYSSFDEALRFFDSLAAKANPD